MHSIEAETRNRVQKKMGKKKKKKKAGDEEKKKGFKNFVSFFSFLSFLSFFFSLSLVYPIARQFTFIPRFVFLRSRSPMRTTSLSHTHARAPTRNALPLTTKLPAKKIAAAAAVVDLEGKCRRRRRQRQRNSTTTSASALPPLLSDLPTPALAALGATAAAALVSAATRFALLSAVDLAVTTRLAASVAPSRRKSDDSDSSSTTTTPDRKRALLLPFPGKNNNGAREGSRDLFLLPDRVGECVAVAKGIDEAWWSRAGVQSGVVVSCRSRGPLEFLNSSSATAAAASGGLFDVVLSRGGLSAAAAAAAAASSSSSPSSSRDKALCDLLAGAARALRPGTGVLVLAERIPANDNSSVISGESSKASAGPVRALTGLGGGGAGNIDGITLAVLEKALEAAPGFSKIALDVVCASTDPHAVAVAFRDEETSGQLAFKASSSSTGGGRGREEEDALSEALGRSKKTKKSSKKGFK